MVFLCSFSLFVIYCNLYSVTMWICALLRVGRREKNVQGSRFVMYRSCPGKTLEAFKGSSRTRRKKERGRGSVPCLPSCSFFGRFFTRRRMWHSLPHCLWVKQRGRGREMVTKLLVYPKGMHNVYYVKVWFQQL